MTFFKVASLYAALEQERSKVKILQAELTRYQVIFNYIIKLNNASY